MSVCEIAAFLGGGAFEGRAIPWKDGFFLFDSYDH